MHKELRRPITSYAKIQHLIGNLIRNRRRQLKRTRARTLHYLNIGCGQNPHADFVNIDYLWHPAVDICWDITKKLPFDDKSMKGVFSEHCLEHFPLEVGFEILLDIYRVLRPGGVLRLVLPDGELYLNTYHAQLLGGTDARFPYHQYSSFRGIDSPILSVNRVFYQDRESSFGHCCMYDFHLLERLLKEVGFSRIVRCDFRSGEDPCLLIDSEDRACESLYVDAIVGEMD